MDTDKTGRAKSFAVPPKINRLVNGICRPKDFPPSVFIGVHPWLI